MADHAHKFPIKKMSQVLGVSRSGYYCWLTQGPAARSRFNQELKEKIRNIWGHSGYRYGSPRIHQELCKQGYRVSRPRVARLMKAMGIASQIRKKWVKTTDTNHSYAVAANLLERDFAPKELSRVWVSDITYIPSEQGWLYLTTVMDLGDRQVLGWSLSRSLAAGQTSLAALQQALARRAPGNDLMFHSDQGVQYACHEFTELLSRYGITQSMSRKGDCWDNAPAESFFKTLKYELDMPGKYASYEQARAAIFEFIEIWYNRKRLHSALGYQTPAQAELNLKQKHAA